MKLELIEKPSLFDDYPFKVLNREVELEDLEEIRIDAQALDLFRQPVDYFDRTWAHSTYALSLSCIYAMKESVIDNLGEAFYREMVRRYGYSPRSQIGQDREVISRGAFLSQNLLQVRRLRTDQTRQKSALSQARAFIREYLGVALEEGMEASGKSRDTVLEKLRETALEATRKAVQNGVRGLNGEVLRAYGSLAVSNYPWVGRLLDEHDKTGRAKEVLSSIESGDKQIAALRAQIDELRLSQEPFREELHELRVQSLHDMAKDFRTKNGPAPFEADAPLFEEDRKFDHLYPSPPGIL